MTLDFVEVNDRFFVEIHCFAVFNQMFESSTKLLAKYVQLFMTWLGLIKDDNSCLSPLFCHVLHKVKDGDGCPRQKGQGPNDAVVKDSRLDCFRIDLGFVPKSNQFFFENDSILAVKDNISRGRHRKAVQRAHRHHLFYVNFLDFLNKFIKEVNSICFAVNGIYVKYVSAEGKIPHFLNGVNSGIARLNQFFCNLLRRDDLLGVHADSISFKEMWLCVLLHHRICRHHQYFVFSRQK